LFLSFVSQYQPQKEVSLSELIAPPSRRGGAPRGNRNALKHGFYARTFSRSDQKDIETYTFKGLQDEIAALRLLNRRAIARAFLLIDDDTAFQDASRIVVGITIALNTTLRTQLELDLHGGSKFDAALEQALRMVSQELGLSSSEHDPLVFRQT
jgi:hypothetical protein